MNSKTHSLIVKVLAVHGVLAISGSMVLLWSGKTVPVELLMVASSIVSGLTGHMTSPPGDKPKTDE